MPNENLLGTLEQSLRGARAARNRLATKLAELEAEADTVRQEIAEMDTLASQTEASIFRLMSSMLSVGTQAAAVAPSDAELEAAMRRDAAARSPYAPKTVPLPHDLPTLRPNIEIKSDRFADRT